MHIDPHLLPTDDEIQHYRRHGWLMTRRLFSDAELDAAVAASERFYAALVRPEVRLPGGPDNRERVHHPAWWHGAGTDVLRKNDYSTLVVPELAALLRKPALGAIAALLAGEDVRLWHDQLLLKPPSSPEAPQAVGWHTDHGYWQTCSSDQLLTAWVPLSDMAPEVGPLTFVDGSHVWPSNDHLDFFSSDLDALERRFCTGGAPIVKVPALLPRGHVSFHHCRTIHGSPRNESDGARRAIALHLQPASNSYIERHAASGRLLEHTNDGLTRDAHGRPQYADPVICPRIGVLDEALRARSAREQC